MLLRLQSILLADIPKSLPNRRTSWQNNLACDLQYSLHADSVSIETSRQASVS